MKRILLLFTGFVAALSILWVGVGHASNVRSGDSPRVMADEVIDGTLYAAGKTLKIEGRIQGDVFCAAETVEITGVVEGDVLCAASNLTVNGEVQGDVRIAAQVARVDGVVEGSVSVLAQEAKFESSLRIGRDATLVAQDAALNGQAGRDVQVSSTLVDFDATVGRNLDITGDEITLHEKTSVAGDFRYISAQKASIADTAAIAGVTEQSMPAEEASPAEGAALTALALGATGFMFLGLALLFAAPRFVHATTNTLKVSPFASFAAGALFLIGLPLVGFVLLSTGIGLLPGIILLMVFGASLPIGLTMAAQRVGELITDKLKWNDSWRWFAGLVLGIFAIFLLGIVPYVGTIVLFGAALWGFGAQWLTLMKRRGGNLGAAPGNIHEKAAGN